MHEQNVEKRAIPLMPLFLINTGSPATTTGQCVEKVAPYFKSAQLRADFAAVTKSMDAALRSQSFEKMCEAVQENHRLLLHIGVVPHPVQQFISRVESIQGAAKICGAGAVLGDSAGALLVLTQEKEALSSLCHRFNYKMMPIAGDVRGIHAA